MKTKELIIALIALIIGIALGWLMANQQAANIEVPKEFVTGATISDNSGNFQECTTIPDGTLYTDDDRLITPGFDIWGYNYQASMFNGGYCDAFEDAEWCQPLKDIDLIMQWNDAYLSNKDCDVDGTLDRHYGFDSYIGSGAWITNHLSRRYVQDGRICTEEYFHKMTAKPTANFDCSANGGEEIWGSFCIIQSFNNDPCKGGHIEAAHVKPTGFGAWK